MVRRAREAARGSRRDRPLARVPTPFDATCRTLEPLRPAPGRATLWVAVLPPVEGERDGQRPQRPDSDAVRAISDARAGIFALGDRRLPCPGEKPGTGDRT